MSSYYLDPKLNDAARRKLKLATIAAVTLTPAALFSGYWIEEGAEQVRLAHQVLPWIRIGFELTALNFLMAYRNQSWFPDGKLEGPFVCFWVVMTEVFFLMFPPLPANLPPSILAWTLIAVVQASYIRFVDGLVASQRKQSQCGTPG